jgi:hypothetical protein
VRIGVDEHETGIDEHVVRIDVTRTITEAARVDDVLEGDRARSGVGAGDLPRHSRVA